MTPSEKEAVAYIRRRFGGFASEESLLRIWSKEIEIFCAGREATFKLVEKEIQRMMESDCYYGIGDLLDSIQNM